MSDILNGVARDEGRDLISIADLLAIMNDRAIGALLFIFAVPNVVPTPPGTSSVLGAPLILLAAQLMLGVPAWLPKVIASRSMARRDFAAMIARVSPWLTMAERFLRPRLCFLVQQRTERVVGGICLALATILFLPITFGNMLPALAICLFALGTLERDGVWIIAGSLTTAAAIALIWGFLYALLKAVLMLLTNSA